MTREDSGSRFAFPREASPWGVSRARNLDPLSPASALALAALAALPLFLDAGFLNTRGGGDSPFLLFRLHQLYTALAQGVFPVRWMPDAAYGLGYPFFNYYAALPYYLAAGLKAFGFGFVLALKLTQLAGFLLAGWGMYRWVRAAGRSRWAALLASAAYTFAPFHMVNVYVRGDSLSEFWAMALYPLILWAALRLSQGPNLNRALALSLSYAALILTHNISALIFTPFLLLYILLLAAARPDPRSPADSRAPTASPSRPDPLTPTGSPSRPDPLTPAGSPSRPDPLTPTGSPSRPDPRAPAGSPSRPDPLTPTASPSRPDPLTPAGSLSPLDPLTPTPDAPQAPRPSRLRSAPAYAGYALALALALSAFFWLPALGETGYVQLGEQTTGYFFYGEHFRTLPISNFKIQNSNLKSQISKLLVQPSFFVNYRLTTDGPTPFSMGLVQVALLLLSLLALLVSALQRRGDTGNRETGTQGTQVEGTLHASPRSIPAGRSTLHDPFEVWSLKFEVFSFLLSTFMLLPASRPLWEHLPLLPLVQFPWRFLSVQSLFAAAVIAGGLSSPSDRAPSQSTHVGTFTLHASLRSIPMGRFTLHASRFTLLLLPLAALGSLRPDFIPLRDADVTPARLGQYETFTGNIGATIRAEYLPEAVVPRPYTSDEMLGRAPRVKTLAGQAQGQRLEERAASQRWRLNVTTPAATVALPLLYFPGWRAEVDGRPVPLSAAPGLGYAQLELPQGEHTVRLWLGRTPLRAAAEVLSLLAAGGWLLAASRGRVTGGGGRGKDCNWRRAGALLALTVAVGVALRLLPPPPASANLTADFEQQGYYSAAPAEFCAQDRAAGAPDPEGCRRARLAGYRYSAGHLRPGETLTVTLDFADLPPDTGPLQDWLALASPADVILHPGNPLDRQGFLLMPRSLVWLRVPDDAPPGVYLPRLVLRGAASTSSGQPRGALYLAPIVVDSPGPAPSPALASFGPTVALLHTPATPRVPDLPPCAMLCEIGPGWLRLGLRWQATADLPQNFALALRLRDFIGSEWYALDTQPARGFYPTGMWRPGEVIPDSYDLRLPDGMPPSAGYTLTLTLYEAGTLAPAGSLDLPLILTLASPLHPEQRARYFPAPGLGLEGVELPASVEQGQTLELSARWLAYETPAANYLARWTLRGPVAYVVDAELAPASPPRSWPAGSFVLGRARLPLPPELPPGEYALGVQLLDGPAGNPVGAEEMVGETRVTGRAREFAPPAVSVPIQATFGGQIRLWGYDLQREGAQLSLTVYWGALARPQKDYKFFLHLIGPDEVPAAQVDGMPRGYSYPTSQWLAGEVVSDTLALDLAGVPEGEYRLALGWYDPADPSARLPAAGPDGAPSGDRVLLPEVVRLP